MTGSNSDFGMPSSSASPFSSVEEMFDFVLTSDMWDEFVDASNDDGYGMKKFGLVALLLFGSFGIVGLVAGAASRHRIGGFIRRCFCLWLLVW